jgi:uncharacterized coiled-coil DUF342 family protein
MDLKQLRQEFQQQKKEAASLRADLNTLNTEKEQHYQEMRAIHDKISQHMQRIKSLKEERDTLTKEVQGLKAERKTFNLALKTKASVKKEADEKRHGLRGVKESPGMLRSQIKKIEYNLETEVMSFKKEQELHKTVKELKNKLQEMAELTKVWDEVNVISADFAQQRRKAEQSHRGVQKKAQASQEKHEQIKPLYEAIKQLRQSEKPLTEKYLAGKKAVGESKIKLEAILKRVTELSKLFKDEEAKDYQSKAVQKTTAVQEKMKKGQKLSTEDILAFQALNE